MIVEFKQQLYSNTKTSNMMKPVFVLCLFACVYKMIHAVPLKEEGKFCDEEINCIETLTLDKNHIKSILTDDSTKLLPEDDHNFNKFLHCYWQARGFQNADGTFNYDNIIENIQEFPRRYFGGKLGHESLIGEEIAVAATESCKNIPPGTSYGQSAVRTQNCIDKRMMELVENEN
ncbi:hypothetical protein RI129_002449 [Pyrocoelia pectoralis]|uniref:Uncharacterized protein n=1 Tax=Pyrocoelia pectoralis TaxID=417401 RepID=A0AAN7ZM74_9COLE